jgi:hypothetical protein
MNCRRPFWIWTACLALWGAVPALAAFTPPPIPHTDLHSSSPASFGQYGEAVAIDGSTLLVGASREGTGAVYVYQRVGGGWREQARLTPEDPAGTLNFGAAVALAGDTAVVGAPREGALVEGAVYVFVRQGGVWTQQARLTSAVPALQGQFGFSVGISGNRLIAGSPGADDQGEDSGAAEVYVRQGGTWTRQARLTAPGATAGDLFGFAVDLFGTTALVGAPHQELGNLAAAGAAHLFTDTTGIWLPLASLRAGDARALDEFGWSVALSFNAAVVGAPHADPNGTVDAGAAYVFEPTGAGGAWRQAAQLWDPIAAAGDEFGFAVGLSGGMAVVGAQRDDFRGADAGAVALFGRLAAGGWSGRGELVSPDLQAHDFFGSALDVSNGVVVAGAFHAHDQGVSRAGQAYVFEPPTPAGVRLLVLPARQTVASGADASFIVNVRNTGAVRLRNVRVTVTGAPACTFSFGPLRVGERRRVSCTLQDLTEDFGGSVFVTAAPLAGFPVSASAEVEITVE